MNKIEFEDNSENVIRALKNTIYQFLEEAGGELHAQVIRNCDKHTDTGDTKKDWKCVVDEAKKEAVIGNPRENAIWEEFGTGDYALEGNGRKTPWFVPVDTYVGSKKPTYKGKVTIVYGKNGRAYYMTNGKSPKRDLQKAYDTKKSAIQQRANELFRVNLK